MRGSRVLVAFLFLFSSFAAQSASAATVWKYDLIVQKLQVAGTGGFIIYMPPGTAPTCQENGTVLSFASGYSGQTAEGIKASLGVVTMAFAMGRPISFAYDDSTCTVSTVLMSR